MWAFESALNTVTTMPLPCCVLSAFCVVPKAPPHSLRYWTLAAGDRPDGVASRIRREILHGLPIELRFGANIAAVTRRDEPVLEANPQATVTRHRHGRVPLAVVPESALANPTPALPCIARDEDAERRTEKNRARIARDRLDQLRLGETTVGACVLDGTNRCGADE
jgi:hypothetical protein